MSAGRVARPCRRVLLLRFLRSLPATPRTVGTLVLTLVFSGLWLPLPASAGITCFGRPATIVGTDGAEEWLVGTDESDVIVGLGGSDEIDGRGGDDFICGNSGSDGISGGPGADRIHGNAGHDFYGGDDPGSDVVFGGFGDDYFGEDYSSSDDKYTGGPGDDFFLGEAGDDIIYGGPGQEFVSFIFAPSPITIDLVKGEALGWGADRLYGVENAQGGDFSDVIRGDDGPNWLVGGASNREFGDDRLVGRGGDDRLDDSFAGDDILLGGRGDDAFMLGIGDDLARGGRGTDAVMFPIAGPGMDGIVLNLETGISTGGYGTDTLVGIDNAAGTYFDDMLIGDEGPNVLNFESVSSYTRGDDVVRGGKGPDTLTGGEGSDQLFGNPGNDDLDGGTESNSNDGGHGVDRCVNPTTAEGATRCESH